MSNSNPALSCQLFSLILLAKSDESEQLLFLHQIASALNREYGGPGDAVEDVPVMPFLSDDTCRKRVTDWLLQQLKAKLEQVEQVVKNERKRAAASGAQGTEAVVARKGEVVASCSERLHGLHPLFALALGMNIPDKTLSSTLLKTVIKLFKILTAIAKMVR